MIGALLSFFSQQYSLKAKGPVMAQNCVGEARYPYGTPFSGPREENQSQVRVAQKQPINHVRQLDEEQPLLVNHSSQEERLNDDCIGRIDRLTTPVMCVLLLGEPSRARRL